jgi:N-carbamoyl-L-amino-acid hydrolase
VQGKANHAGTTPMDSRADALLAAARVVAGLPDLAAVIPDQRATCGRITVAPGAVNVIPNEAVFTVDLRNGDDARLAEAERRLKTLVEESAARGGVTVSMRKLGRVPPARCHADVLSKIETSAKDLNLPFRRMISGAGHDAQILSRVCPTAMIFIPNRDGLSHSPYEYASPEAVENGANVLLGTVLKLAG